MMIDLILFALGLVGLLIGSTTDLQRREVPDYINYGLIAAACGIRLLHAILMNDWLQLLFAVIGGFFCFGIACIFFYTGQWGGGDAKMLIAMGALFATFHSFVLSAQYTVPAIFFAWFPDGLIQHILDYNLLFIGYLIINILIAGAIYGILWSLALAVIHRTAWWDAVKKLLRTKRMRVIGVAAIISVVVLCILGLTMQAQQAQLLRLFFFGLAVVVIFGYSLQLAVTAVERACMIRTMLVSDLTEGEWIQKKIVVDGKYICGPKDLGVTEDQIKLLKKKRIKSVVVKIGIPFIPAFLIGFLTTVFIGNIFIHILTL